MRIEACAGALFTAGALSIRAPNDPTIDLRNRGRSMLDVAYVFGTLAFFALMFAYVHACAALGEAKSSNGERAGAEPR